MSTVKTVAWLRDAGEPSISTMAHVIVTPVRDLWLKANPPQVERYTVPLVLRSDYESAEARAQALAAEKDQMSYYQQVQLSDALKAVDAANERAQKAEQALAELMALKDLKDMLELRGINAWEGMGAEWDDYHKRKPAAWAVARAIGKKGSPL